MLTEQLLTEDIEIDNEPVEQNTAHSLFFDTYYQSLTAELLEQAIAKLKTCPISE